MREPGAEAMKPWLRHCTAFRSHLVNPLRPTLGRGDWVVFGLRLSKSIAGIARDGWDAVQSQRNVRRRKKWESNHGKRKVRQ
jgi:hypothetical protein